MTSTNKAIIFDMDGVIVKTEQLKAEAHVATVKKLGGFATSEIYSSVMGQSQEVVNNYFIKSSDIKVDNETYSSIFHREYDKLLDEGFEFMPGIPKFLDILVRNGYILGIVSSSSRKVLRKVFNKIAIKDFFDVVISGDDVKEPKPSPEPYLLALKRLNVTSQQAVVFEDSETGVMSAQNAGIPVIAVRHSYNIAHNFSNAAYSINYFDDTALLLQLIKNYLSNPT